MSILSALPIIGQIVGGPISKILDNLGEDDRREFEYALSRLENEYQVQVAQIEANKAAANHGSMFVAGARPFILWVCGIGIAGIALLFVLDALNVSGLNIDREAVKDGQDFILALALPLLGIGGMRSWEKVKGVARNRM